LSDIKPLPNPWNEYPTSSTGTRERVDGAYMNMNVQANYININGEEKTINNASPMKIIGLSCCPCFIDPCSRENVDALKRACLSFCFIMGIIDVIMLIVTIIYNQGFESFSVNPWLGPSTQTLIAFGAKEVTLIKSGQIYRFLTPMILHAGIFHLLMNLFAQLRYGIFLERKWGTPKFIAIYVISGIGATLLSCITSPSASGVGASGAISGLMGAHLISILITWNKTNKVLRSSMLTQILFWIVILLITGIGSRYIDFWAHFGGLVTGAIVSCLVFGNEFEKNNQRRMAQIVSTIVMTILFAIGFILLWTVI